MAPITRRDRPSVFTIPAALPFADTLVAGLRAHHGGAPADWPAITLLVPNRRAVRAVTDAFLRAAGGRAALLPRIRPLGDIDIDDLGFEDAALAGALDLDIPPAIGELERQLLLTRLVQRFEARRGDAPMVPGQAAKLAAALARFIDQMAIEGLDPAGLDGLAPERFAAHWQQTLDFLAIVTREWPKVLAARGQIDPAARRNRLLAAQQHAWTHTPPPDPVIAAGSTGSIPAVAALLATVARLAHGAVILPGLDRDMDAQAWETVGDCHPQGG
ncbi:MAG: double-strand break repair protein AddB, partial [Alphaproteobacteria bacterium]